MGRYEIAHDCGIVTPSGETLAALDAASPEMRRAMMDVMRWPSRRDFDAAIRSFPTIREGHFDNLKLEWSTTGDNAGDCRMWVSRMTREDGARYDCAIVFEHCYRGSRSSWGWRQFERPGALAVAR